MIDWQWYGWTERRLRVTRRECGSCRFFEQSGIGESGYCRNQRCHAIVGLALVRRQELACRVGWDQDYYEPTMIASDAIPGQNRPSAEPTRYRSGYQGMRPDDIIVGMEQPRPAQEPSSAPVARPRTSNVGEAHRRALERRQIAQQTGDAVPPRRLSGVMPAIDPARLTEPLPEKPNRRERPLTGDEGVSPPRLAESYAPAPPVATPPPAHLAATTNLPVARTTQRADAEPPQGRQSWTPPPGMQTAPARYSEQPTAPPPPMENRNGGYSLDVPPAATLPEGPPATPLETEWYAAERQRHRGKRCANCRDYQVAENGDRGWCRNRFAFPTPQLVGPNDLACLSCIGTWWAANDQWWLAKVAVQPQTMPTPLADALLEELREEEKRQATLRRPGTG